MQKRKRAGLVMVGYERPGSENLSLRRVAGAAQHAGYPVSVCTADSLASAPSVLRAAIKSEPTVLGFVLQDPHSAVHSLAQAELARKFGYTGYIVCAGEFAALQPDFVLERAPSVDGVLRHEGGIPMTELLKALEKGTDLLQVSCLHTREFKNPPRSSLGEPFRRPIRGERLTVMGVPTAEIIASRGCAAQCEYCTHAAMEASAVSAARCDGTLPVGVPSVKMESQRRRDLRDLADEMAELYHDKGVRHFGFSDENIVPLQEQAALAWACGFKEALVSRGITDASMGFMTRADALTEPVADALVKLGLIRTLTGVEAGNPYGLASLGRSGHAGSGRRGLKLLVERNVVTLFNDIIFHSETTVESIQNEIQFLREVRGALFDTVQVTPFIGTALSDRMIREGRLSGGRILPTFRMKDPILERFRSLLSRYQTQVFGAYNPTLRANDLLFSAALAVRHGNQIRRADEIAAALRILAEHINLTRVDTLEMILNAAVQGSPADDVIASAKEQFRAVAQRLNNAETLLRNLAAPPRLWPRHEHSDPQELSVSRTYLNFAAAAAIVFVVSGTSGCKHTAAISSDTDPDTPSETATVSDAETAADSETVSDSETTGDSEFESDSTSDVCTESERSAANQQLTDLIYGNCNMLPGSDTLKITIGRDGTVQSVVAPDAPANDPDVTTLIDCVQAILKDEEFPCLEGEEVWISLPPIKVIA